MSNLVRVRRVVKFLRRGTAKGKIDKLEALTESLVTNTEIVAKKYTELGYVEQEVRDTVENLRGEMFDHENSEIDNLDGIPLEDREKFKMSLVSIKEKGLAELEPISGTAQKIKAHMLITLNKANIQKAILLAKTKLAGNAHLQLKTLNIIKKETVNINCELEDLLRELDTLNNNAIDSFSSFKTDISKTVKNNESVNAISSILTKIQSTPAQLKKQREVDKKKTKLETKDL